MEAGSLHVKDRNGTRPVWTCGYKSTPGRNRQISIPSSTMSPNPSNLDSFNHQSTELSTGRTYHYVDQLPANYDADKTVTLLLVHGFPDLWYAFVSE